MKFDYRVNKVIWRDVGDLTLVLKDKHWFYGKDMSLSWFLKLYKYIAYK